MIGKPRKRLERSTGQNTKFGCNLGAGEVVKGGARGGGGVADELGTTTLIVVMTLRNATAGNPLDTARLRAYG